MKLKNKIKSWRHRLEIDSQKKFAELLEVDQSQINRWEKQKVQPDLITSWKIANKLTKITGNKVYIEDLFEPSE